MGMLFGGGGNNPVTQYQGLDIQTSCQGVGIPLLWGRTMISGNLIWYGDFQSKKQSAGGKGGLFGGGGDQWYYYCSFILGLCQGPLPDNAIMWVWNGQTAQTLAVAGVGLAAPGDWKQPPWGYLTTNHPTQALGYSNLVYLAFENYCLGTAATVPSLTVVANGLIQDAPNGIDAQVYSVIEDALTNPIYGLGFPSFRLDACSNFIAYCHCVGFYVSPAVQDQSAASDLLSKLIEYTNAEYIWDAHKLTIVPYGDKDLSSGGFNYTAPTALYDFDDDDFLLKGNDDPVECTRKRPSDAYNSVRMEYLMRNMPGVLEYSVTDINTPNETGQYESGGEAFPPMIAWAFDQSAIEAYGERPEQTCQAHFFCLELYAQQAAQLRLQRIRIMNTYKFDLGWKWIILNPMDIITITDVTLGLDHLWVRIKEIEENDNGDLTFTCEEYWGTTGTAVDLAASGNTPYSPYANTDPGLCNAPIIWEAPAAEDNALEICVAVSGGVYSGQMIAAGDGVTTVFQLCVNYNGGLSKAPITSLNGVPVIYVNGVVATGWTASASGAITFTTPPANNSIITADFVSNSFSGGFAVYGSTDGTTYKLLGRMPGPSRMGVLSANLATSSVSPDTTHTLSVNMLESGGELTGGTDQDAQLLNTLCYVDGEYIAYAGANLTSLNNYDLSYLVRGAYGTPMSAHSAGAPFARIDGSVFKSTFIDSLIGQTIHLKFLAQNSWGISPGDISDCVAYPFTVTGLAGIMLDPTGFSATITNKNDVLLQWGVSYISSTFDCFEVWSGVSIAAGTLISKTKQFKHLITDPAPGTSTYWVRMKSSLGTYDPNPPSVTITLPSPSDVTSLTATITTKQDVQLKWAKPTSLPKGFSAYEIRSGSSWAAGTFVAHTKQPQYLFTSPSPGTVTYWVGVMDLAGNYDATPSSVSITVPYPGDVTSLAATVTNKRDIQLKWTKPSTFPNGFEAYEIRSALSNVGWASATFVNRTKQTSYLVTDPTSGTTYYWVGTLDLAGNYDQGAPYVVATLPVLPDVTGLTATVTKKNDVQLKWNALSPLPTGFSDYEVRSASSNVGWASATILHKTKQAQLLITDPPTGTVYYWVGVVDLAGNYDPTPPSVTGSISAGFTLIGNIQTIFPSAAPDTTGLSASAPLLF